MNAAVDLLWLPLGAGDSTGLVRRSGRAFEAISARRERREALELYHSALLVHLDGHTFAVEMTPAWGVPRDIDRGVVATGSVGLAGLGRLRLFRYEVHGWRDGMIPDADEADGPPLRLSEDSEHAEAVLRLLPRFPTYTWGRDEQDAGEMWNSNSLTAWLLARSGHDPEPIQPPPHGRAPGWRAGLAIAARELVSPRNGASPIASPGRKGRTRVY